MHLFTNFLNQLEKPAQRERLSELFSWIELNFPELEAEIKWKQPMFLAHGTFIIGFSVAKNHLAVAPEKKTIQQFATAIKEAGYESSANLIKIKWEEPFDYTLIKELIAFNLADKKEASKFWR